MELALCIPFRTPHRPKFWVPIFCHLELNTLADPVKWPILLFIYFLSFLFFSINMLAFFITRTNLPVSLRIKLTTVFYCD